MIGNILGNIIINVLSSAISEKGIEWKNRIAFNKFKKKRYQWTN